MSSGETVCCAPVAKLRNARQRKKGKDLFIEAIGRNWRVIPLGEAHYGCQQDGCPGLKWGKLSPEKSGSPRAEAHSQSPEPLEVAFKPVCELVYVGRSADFPWQRGSPESHGMVLGSCGQAQRSGSEGQMMNRPIMPLQHGDQSPALSAPNPGGPIERGRRQEGGFPAPCNGYSRFEMTGKHWL